MLKIQLPLPYDRTKIESTQLTSFIEEWDSLTTESEKGKHVFACAGLALHDAQCMEVSLCTLLLVAGRVTGKLHNETDFDSLDALLSKQTCGELIKRAVKQVEIDANSTQLLDLALLARNDLAHSFFYRNAARFSTGRQFELVRELVEYSQRFRTADGLISEAFIGLLRFAGMTDEMVEREIELLRNQASQRV